MNWNRSTLTVPAIAGAFALLLLAVLLGYWLGHSSDPTKAIASTGKATATDSDVLYWYDPMKPEQHFDKPGKSPYMDMQLVAKYAAEAGASGVAIDPGARQNLGIRTAPVESGRQGLGEVTVSGTLQWDLRGEQRISSRVDGFVDRVMVRAPFERVRAGQALASLQAPRLATAIAEYRALTAAKSAEARSVRAAAASRLRLLGISEAEARATDGAIPRVLVRAPADGVLAEVMVRAGDNVAAGQAMFRFNATDKVWLEARIAQPSAAVIEPGTAVDIRVTAFPGETFRGELESLIPELDPSTRTQAARVVVDNREGRLAAGMFAEAILPGADAGTNPWIPSEALIASGSESRVIISDAGNRFHPARVRTGRQSGGRTEILAGLEVGQRVVVSGQFLLDSEASLSGALNRLDPP